MIFILLVIMKTYPGFVGICNIVFVLCSYLSFNVTCVVVCLLLRFSNGASRCSRVKVFFLLIKSSTVQESLNLLRDEAAL